MKKIFKNIFSPKKISYFIFLGIISVIIYVLLTNNGEKFIDVFISFNFKYLWILCFLYMIALLFATFNWFLIISRFEKKISWQEHFKIYLITLVARRLPGTLWYIGGRIVLYQKKNSSAQIVSLASGIEHVFGFASGLVLGFILISNRINYYFNNYLFLIIILVIILFIVIHPYSVNFFLRLLKRPTNESINYSDSIRWIFSGLLLKIVTGMMVSVIALGYSNLSFGQIVEVMGIWAITSSITSLVFFLPSNFGITELTFSGLSSAIVPFEVSLSIAIMMRVITTLFEILVSGIFFFIYLNSRNGNCGVEFEKPHQPKE